MNGGCGGGGGNDDGCLVGVMMIISLVVSCIEVLLQSGLFHYEIDEVKSIQKTDASLIWQLGNVHKILHLDLSSEAFFFFLSFRSFFLVMFSYSIFILIFKVQCVGPVGKAVGFHDTIRTITHIGE